MDMVIALLPALFFGATGIITTLLGGKAVQGTLGMTYGAVMDVVKLVYKCKVKRMSLVTVEK